MVLCCAALWQPFHGGCCLCGLAMPLQLGAASSRCIGLDIQVLTLSKWFESTLVIVILAWRWGMHCQDGPVVYAVSRDIGGVCSVLCGVAQGSLLPHSVLRLGPCTLRDVGRWGSCAHTDPNQLLWLAGVGSEITCASIVGLASSGRRNSLGLYYSSTLV
jgi:hypothetical protein